VRSDELSDAAAHHSTPNWNGAQAASGSGSIELQQGLAKAGGQGQRLRAELELQLQLRNQHFFLSHTPIKVSFGSCENSEQACATASVQLGCDSRYSLLHLQCHSFMLKSQSMMKFSRSLRLLPHSVEKRPGRLRLEIEIRD